MGFDAVVALVIATLLLGGWRIFQPRCELCGERTPRRRRTCRVCGSALDA
jgi:predicted amidophosphoribosyltransferase